MPIELPNLDDRTYDDLMQEALSLIPSYAQDWTNFNPSDPGITLLELFAYLSEMMIYRLDRVTDANQYAFLKLLNGADWQRSPQKDLNQEIRDTVLKIRRSERAVTIDDFERLALAADPLKIARVRCIPRRNLVSENPLNPEERAGQVSLVIVPYPPENAASDSQERLKPQPTPELLTKVREYLETRRLLTTRVQVVAPRYVELGVNFTLYLNRDVKKSDIEKDKKSDSDIETKVMTTLQNFLHPLTGGADGKGWTFGRNVYVSELYDLLDRYKGINYVTATEGKDELTVNDPKRLIKDKNNKLIAIQIQPEELVTSGNINLQFISPLDAGNPI